MTKTEISQHISQFLANGGKVKVIPMSTTRFKTWNGKSGAYNRGAKKIGLQDRNFAS